MSQTSVCKTLLHWLSLGRLWFASLFSECIFLLLHPLHYIGFFFFLNYIKYFIGIIAETEVVGTIYLFILLFSFLSFFFFISFFT